MTRPIEGMLSAGTRPAGVPSASRMLAWVKALENGAKKDDTTCLVRSPDWLGTDISIRLRGGFVSFAAEIKE